MKRFLLIAAAAALIPAAASAAVPVIGAPATDTITINGRVTAQCVVSGDNTATLSTGLAGTDGFLASGLQTDLLAQLNGTHTVAWCSGATNTVVASRTMLVRSGSDGSQGADGFANAVLYDVGIDIDGVTRPGYTYEEGTSDGSSTGPVLGRFGPTGAGATVAFVTDSSGPGAFLNPVTGATTSATDNGASAGFSTLPNVRLAAGDYAGTVTLTLTPGV